MERATRQWFEEVLRQGDVDGAARRLGFEVVGVPVEGSAFRAWGLSEERFSAAARLRVLVAQPGLRWLHLQGESCWREVREAILAVHRAAPEATVVWWWSTQKSWTVAMVEVDRRGKRRIKRLTLDREHPDEVGILQWMGLAAQRRVDEAAVVDARGWRRHFSQVLDQDGVTRRFFDGFARGLETLIETMSGGPDDREQRHDLALITLLRVIFLYFLQARGALGGDRRFVARRFRGHRRDESFYRAVLRPLFFGALNCPRHRRGEAARALGDLPFLNGGLFEPGPLEELYSDLDWEDSVWGEILEGLFERHRFAVEWSHTGDLGSAVDPEMLGKVFEGLMYGSRRRRSGAFYTPRHVVEEMVERTLGAWLGERAGLDEDEAQALIVGEAEALDGASRRRAREALAQLTVLDPAVGTGAFLLEMLRVLRRIDHGLDAAAGVVRTPGERYDRMRALVHDHLFGVDINPTAVRLCELRIWLAMLAALPELPAAQMPPLPNLSHRLCAGNSLIEPLDWLRFRAGDEAGAWVVGRPRLQEQKIRRLAALQRDFTRAHGEEKQALKKALEAARLEVERELVQARRTKIAEKLRPLEDLKASQDLFGESTRLSKDQQRQLEALRREQAALDEARDALAADRERPAAFCFDSHFAPVMARGGFELVVTNPPWVRASHIDGATRKLYRARYGTGDRRLWRGAAEAEICATFGSQVDLSALFMERSLELLRPGGRLCALVPVKLFRSLHGASLRGSLAEHRLELLEDLCDQDDELFDATTYPAILRVRRQGRRRPRSQALEVGVWRRGKRRRFRSSLQELLAVGDDPRAPWVMVEPPVTRLLRKVRAASVPLGTVSSLAIRGGVKTGCNRAFVLSPEQARERFGDPQCQPYLRWALRGRDVDAGGIRRSQKIIWPVDEAGEIVEALPTPLAEHFEAHREVLEGRSDYRGGPLWTLFRRHDEVEQPGVAWRDLGEQLEAVAIDGPTIPLNTVYYIPTTDDRAAQALIALLHAEASRATAFAVGERARGGWRRHFAWVIRMLPVPRGWLKAWRAGDFEALLDCREVDRLFGVTPGEVAALKRWRVGEEPALEVA